MTATIGRLADRMLRTVAPKIDASAACTYQWTQYCYCVYHVSYWKRCMYGCPGVPNHCYGCENRYGC